MIMEEADSQDYMAGDASKDASGACRVQEEEQIDETEENSPPYRAVSICNPT
jgi:hypothetical protein